MSDRLKYDAISSGFSLLVTGSKIMSEAQFKSFFDRISPLAAGYCVCFGLMVLIGWVSNIDFLKNPMPHQFPVSPVVAFCFICSGSALFLGRQGNHQSKTALRVAACVIFALIVLVMLTYTTGGILDLEQAILPYPLGGISEFAPGRISFHGALGMFLVSICLFLLSLEQNFIFGLRELPVWWACLAILR